MVLKKIAKLFLENNALLTPEVTFFFSKEKNPLELVNNGFELVKNNVISIRDLENIDTWEKIKQKQIHTKKGNEKTFANFSPTKNTTNRIVQYSERIYGKQDLFEPELLNQDTKSIINEPILRNFEPKVEIIKDVFTPKKFRGTVDDFVEYFQSRYKKLSKILKIRQELAASQKIASIRDGEKTAIIAMITDKRTTKNGHILLTVEDETGQQAVLLNRNNKRLMEDSQAILLDSVLGFVGTTKNGLFFPDEIIWPDVPYKHQINYADVPVYAAFLSDIHVGSKEFLAPVFKRFIKFLRGEGTKEWEKRLGPKVKYVFFAGDEVDGIGVYPKQENDLLIDDINEQYDVFASFINEFPDDVTVFVIPGNHDMVRRAEPQPKIPSSFANSLADMDNVYLVSNPSLVRTHGVKTLLYHCTPMLDMVNHLPMHTIERPADIMREMLRIRHLSPIYGERSPIVPEKEDHLVIEELPDIFHGGHVHIHGFNKYRGILIVNSGTMQSQTEYQKQLNITPTPGKITLINLNNHLTRHLEFYK